MGFVYKYDRYSILFCNQRRIIGVLPQADFVEGRKNVRIRCSHGNNSFTLAASLTTQVDGNTPPHYTSNDSVEQTDDNSSDDKPEQKLTLEQIDNGPVKKVSKKRSNVCSRNCPEVWQPYQLAPWPIDELRQSI
jgi:hypothetical protein